MFTEGVDYSSINEFDNFTRSRDVSFEIEDDDISEGLESFRLELRNVDGELERATSIVTIVDDESKYMERERGREGEME